MLDYIDCCVLSVTCSLNFCYHVCSVQISCVIFIISCASQNHCGVHPLYIAEIRKPSPKDDYVFHAGVCGQFCPLRTFKYQTVSGEGIYQFTFAIHQTCFIDFKITNNQTCYSDLFFFMFY